MEQHLKVQPWNFNNTVETLVSQPYQKFQNYDFLVHYVT